MFKNVLVVVISTIILVGCGQPTNESLNENPDLTSWEIVKSPETGKCYEVMTHQLQRGQRIYSSGMSEISCSYYKKE